MRGADVNAGTVSSQTAGKTISLVGPSSDFSFANQGLLEAAGGAITAADNLSNSGTLLARADGTINVTGPFNNTGTVHATDGGSITLTSSNMANLVTTGAGKMLSGGNWVVDANSTLSIPSTNIADNAANITLSGLASIFDAINALAQNDGQLTLKGGRDFATSSDLVNNGTLTTDTGSDLLIGGNLNQLSSGTLGTELLSAATDEDFGQFSVSGTANLDGRLLVTAADGASVSPGDHFVVLQAANVNGVFSAVEFPVGWNGNVLYESTAVIVNITAVPEPRSS